MGGKMKKSYKITGFGIIAAGAILGAMLWTGTPILAKDSGSVTYSDCTSEAQPGDTCLLKPEKLYPTQPNVGAIQVQCKTYKYNEKSGTKMGEYLNDFTHHVPAIIGPKGNFYMTDHHHMTTAMWLTQDKYGQHTSWQMRVDVLETFYGSSMSMGEFWDYMVKNNFAYLYDNGQPISWQELPASVTGLTDDPYRSQAGFQKNEGLLGFIKPVHNAMFFLEFKWGDLMRQKKVLGASNSIPPCSPGGAPWYDGNNPCANQATVQADGLAQGYNVVTAEGAKPVMTPQCMDSSEGLFFMCGYNPKMEPSGKYPYPNGAEISKKCNVRAKKE